MISCRTIIGTAVIEIEKGIGLGQIHQVLVDEGVLLTFVVKGVQGGEDYALLPGSNIHGIGDFAAMVKNSSSLQVIDETGLSALTEKQGAIFDEMVITVDGNKIGRVVDYHIDPKNEIGFLVVNPENEGAEIQIPKSQILMIGKEYIILNESKGIEADSLQSSVAQVPEVKLAETSVAQPAAESPVTPLTAGKEDSQPEAEDEVLDREAIFAQFDAAALMAKKPEEAEETESAPASQFDFLAQPQAEADLSQAADETVERAEEPVQEADALTSLDAAFNLTSESAEEPVAEADLAEQEQENRSEGRVIQMTAPASEEGSNFLNEQKRLLVGKRLQKDLVGPDGNAILLADEVVTDGTIDLLRRIDRRLLVRLAGCVV